MNRVLTTYIFLAATLLISGVATAQVQVGGRVFGGGNLAPVSGNTEVMIKQTGATVAGDVYGGGALADVGTLATNETAATTHIVTITAGTIGGDVYGGGLGQKQIGDDPNTAIAAAVNGVVTVNIGTGTENTETHFAASTSGSATFNGSVFGCNNANGTPKDNVTVNIWQTAHTTKNAADYHHNDSTFAIAQVFGGGNQAHYEPITTGKKAIVHVWTCDNTIEYLYGGGNAADVGNATTSSADAVIIDGGRIAWVFGGGNGAGASNPGANIFGNTSVTFRAGDVEYLFGGSNEKGNITGQKTISIPNDNQACVEGHDNHITELYGGNNKADAIGDISLTMPCSPGSDPCPIDYIFGGSREANITGNVTLTIEGGDYQYVFGGNNLGGTITGNVTLNLYGGTIHHDAFGGNKGGGSITGNITVTVEDHCSCPLSVDNVFGAGDQAIYTAPTGEGTQPNNPIVYVNNLCNNETVHQTITGNVYGGGNGDPTNSEQTPGMVTGNPKVIIGDLANDHGSYVAAISGNVYGGGNAAKVVGNTTVLMQKANSVVGHDIYGGGNLAHVSGSTTVQVTGGTVTQDVYGGGALANVGTSSSDHTIVTLSGGTVRDIYGGGLGRQANQEQGITAVEAKVYGPVQVTVTGGTVTNAVYGCNNANGAPQSTVKVDIYGTDAPAQGQTYALSKVFGGGNMAAYGGTPDVTIHNCDNKIGEVYGGGNAASVVNTNVIVYGGNTIGQVFAGGNGEGVDPSHVMVSGNAVAHIYGGTIGQVFGGNNSNGTISGNASALYIDKQPEQENGNACTMKIGEVYGGGNLAAGNASAITIGCTGTLVPLGANQHYGTDQEGIGTVYGGANAAGIGNNITLNIISGIVENVFGGNNASGSINGTITVNINKDESNTATCPDDWYVGNVYGGGNLAPYTGSPAVTISNGLVSGDVFGGGLGTTAVVTGNPVVLIDGGTVDQNVFGGGSLAAVSGNTHVTVNSGAVNQDVYGGGAFANTGATTVDIMGGTITGDIYGGGLGDDDHAPEESGVVTVNIGAPASGNINELTEHLGSATIGGSVYGCNNAKGSPQDNVFVNIYGTAHTTTDMASYIEDDGHGAPTYAIANVFGGGNQANYLANKIATVKVYGCANTIRRTFGGGNAAATNDVNTDIMGGRFDQVFGGGNGEVTAANINGDVDLSLHGGYVGQFFGGSNTSGSISGDINVVVDNNGPCGGNLVVDEFFCGGNYVDITGDLETTIECSQGMEVHNLYGGCNMANISGHVVLNVYGGIYTNVFGGSKGDLANLGPTHTTKAANIDGYVTLNLYGGTIENAYGGSNVNGNIGGLITVNILDEEDPDCPLYVTNIYGGSNMTAYTPSFTPNTGTERISPVVNVVHAKYGVAGNVYGGSKGVEGTAATVTASPRVNIGYNADMNGYIPSTGPNAYNVPSSRKTIVAGNVYGGCDAAIVDGNTAIYLRDRAKVFGNVYGGGNMGEVTGNTKVIVNGANQ